MTEAVTHRRTHSRSESEKKTFLFTAASFIRISTSSRDKSMNVYIRKVVGPTVIGSAAYKCVKVGTTMETKLQNQDYLLFVFLFIWLCRLDFPCVPTPPYAHSFISSLFFFCRSHGINSKKVT